jgi:hypothetical protein
MGLLSGWFMTPSRLTKKRFFLNEATLTMTERYMLGAMSGLVWKRKKLLLEDSALQ